MTAAQALGIGAAATLNNAVGHCVRDTFVVTSTGKATPVICGVNSGQHGKYAFIFRLTGLVIQSLTFIVKGKN